MAKLIVSEFVTLDGVMEAPGGEPTHPHSGWVFDFLGPEQNQYKLDEVREAASLLLGRVTYEGFAAAWPSPTTPIVTNACHSASPVAAKNSIAAAISNAPVGIVPRAPT